MPKMIIYGEKIKKQEIKKNFGYQHKYVYILDEKHSEIIEKSNADG